MTLKSERDRTELPSTAVIEAVAECLDTDPSDLDHPLYGAIDPDALDAVVASNGMGVSPGGVTVAFAYEGCQVRVSDGPSVKVSPISQE